MTLAMEDNDNERVQEMIEGMSGSGEVEFKTNNEEQVMERRGQIWGRITDVYIDFTRKVRI